MKKIVSYLTIAICSWIFIVNPLVGIKDTHFVSFIFLGPITSQLFTQVLSPYYTTIALGIIIDILLIKI